MEENVTKQKRTRTRSPHTEETKQKMSESGKKKIFTDEHKANLSKAQVGRKMSQEAIDKSNLAKMAPIQAGNVCYLGIKTAAEDLGLSRKAVLVRLDSNNYPDWQRINKP